MYKPRHARPSCLPARAAVSTGLMAVLLPIALASPAIAEDAVPPTSTTTAAEPATAPAQQDQAQTTMRISADSIASDGRARIGVRLLADGEYVGSAQVAVQKQTDAGWTEIARLTTDGNGLAVGNLPFSGETRVRATYAGDATRSPGVSPEALVRRQVASTLRISAGAIEGDGRARLGARLLRGDGSPVVGEYVAFDVLAGDGTWRYIGKVLTDGGGHGTNRYAFGRDTRVRARFAGNATTLRSTSPEAVVRASLGQRAVQIASQQAGKPYRYGSTGPNSFDCSGFTTYIYKTRLGRNIPRTSAQQAASIPRVAQSAKRPGDLLFFRTGGRVTHVGVYAGGNKMWAAPTTGDRVKLQSIYTSRYTVGRVS